MPADLWWMTQPNTPLGPLTVFSSTEGIRKISLDPLPEGSQSFAIPNEIQKLLTNALSQLEEYLSGNRTRFDLPLDFHGISPFQIRVYQAAQKVSFGSTATYSALARNIGVPGGAQAVGGALAHNPYLFVVPCHRILDQKGGLHGFSAPGGVKTKAWLLHLEGITIVN
jgi:methylated-DNA-[protein]-cysteine S-methyltransferase